MKRPNRRSESVWECDPRQSSPLSAFAATTLRNIRRGDSEASLMQRLGAFQVDNGQSIDNRASAQLFTVLSRVAFGDL